jgi:hypothetical protein
MTESKPSLGSVEVALLDNEAFVEALSARLGVLWGLGENPVWFFGQLSKKIRELVKEGGAWDVKVVPMVFASAAAKELHSRKNDLKGLSYALSRAEANGNAESVVRLATLVAETQARVAQLEAENAAG